MFDVHFSDCLVLWVEILWIYLHKWLIITVCLGYSDYFNVLLQGLIDIKLNVRYLPDQHGEIMSQLNSETACYHSV
jgi:hypothetical protein